MHVDETNLVREMKRLWTTRRWIFSDLFSRVSKTSRAFLSRIMMFFNPCRESVFHFSFGLDSNVWAKYGRRGDYFATTTFNVDSLFLEWAEEVRWLCICRYVVRFFSLLPISFLKYLEFFGRARSSGRWARSPRFSSKYFSLLASWTFLYLIVVKKFKQ